MKRCGMSWALGVWLGWATLVSAQAYLPEPVGAARLPDPDPTATAAKYAKIPPMTDGPLNAQIAPPGPPDSLSLPEGLASAFMAEPCALDSGVYCSLGMMALRRQHLGAGTTAYLDATGPPATNNPLALPPGLVGGPLLSFNDIGMPYHLGMRGTFGYFWNGQSVEATVWGIFQNNTSRSIYLPSGIYSFFFNPPTGFDPGIWLEADQQVMKFSWSMYNIELNYRYASAAVLDLELLLGVRYLNLREQLSVDTTNLGRGGAPLEEATYFVGTRNNLIAPQIGVEWSRTLKFITIGFTGKAALGGNVATVETSLVRGDKVQGFADQRTASRALSGVWELNAWLDLNILERMKIHGGYTALWVTGVTLSVDQFDYNLAYPPGRPNNDGSLFFHGPMVEISCVF